MKNKTKLSHLDFRHCLEIASEFIVQQAVASHSDALMHAYVHDAKMILERETTAKYVLAKMDKENEE